MARLLSTLRQKDPRALFVDVAKEMGAKTLPVYPSLPSRASIWSSQHTLRRWRVRDGLRSLSWMVYQESLMWIFCPLAWRRGRFRRIMPHVRAAAAVAGYVHRRKKAKAARNLPMRDVMVLQLGNALAEIYYSEATDHMSRMIGLSVINTCSPEQLSGMILCAFAFGSARDDPLEPMLSTGISGHMPRRSSTQGFLKSQGRFLYFTSTTEWMWTFTTLARLSGRQTTPKDGPTSPRSSGGSEMETRTVPLWRNTATCLLSSCPSV